MKSKSKKAATEQLSEEQAVDARVAELGGVYTDAHGKIWSVRAVHYNGKHYLRYETKMDGQEIDVSGPHGGSFYCDHRWRDGRELLNALGIYNLSCTNLTSLDEAIEWAYMAPELAEEAINRHINRNRTEAAIRKLEKEKDEAIEAITRKHDEQVAEIYSKAGLSPDTTDL